MATLEYANEILFAKWYSYAEENNIEIDLKVLGLDKQRKDTFGYFLKISSKNNWSIKKSV